MDANITLGNGLIDPFLINSVFAEQAMTVRWYPARRCSCWGQIDLTQVASGSPDPNCPICHGNGRLWPESYNVTGVILDGMTNLAMMYDDSGVNYVGRIIMFVPYSLYGQTVPMYTDLALYDLIWAQDITLSTRWMVKRGTDSLREQAIGNVEISYGTTTYQMGVDFRVIGKSIEWISTGPPMGDDYEAKYEFHPWFSVVVGQPIARNFAHLNLPRQVTLEITPEYGEVFPVAYGG